MAAKALKITTVVMLVMVLMHNIEYAASDSQACKGDCAKTCTDGQEVDFDCFLSCVEKCDDDDDDDDDYPPILIGARKLGKEFARQIKVIRLSTDRGNGYERYDMACFW